MKEPYQLDVHRTRTIHILKTQNDGDIEEVYPESARTFVDSRLFMLGGAPTTMFQSWTAVITLTDYEVSCKSCKLALS